MSAVCFCVCVYIALFQLIIQFSMRDQNAFDALINNP